MTDDFLISAIDMRTVDSRLGITEGIAYDPPFLYITPHNDFVIAKLDTRTFAIVATLDLSLVSANLQGLSDAFVVGRYLYIMPHYTQSGTDVSTSVVRVDLDNFTPGGVSTLHIIDSPTASNAPRDGFNDGVHGYSNVRTVPPTLKVIRWGMGAQFTPDSVSTIVLTATTGPDGAYPIVQGNFLSCDATFVYGVAVVAHVPASDPGGRQSDLWLVRIPIADWRAEAATFTRMTHYNFPMQSIPIPFQLVDTGDELWTFPIPLVLGPWSIAGAGPWLGGDFPAMKIPKYDPSTAVVTVPPVGQTNGFGTGGSGQAWFDGWRYGYVTSSDVGKAAKLIQLDTHNPGTVNFIDLSAWTAYPLWGTWGDGYWAYAVSFNGGFGVLLRYRPTLPPSPSPLDMVTLETVGENLVTFEIETED